MAAIIIFPTHIITDGIQTAMHGDCRVEPGSESIPWSVPIVWSQTTAQLNTAMTNAAVAAAQAAGHIIGGADRKIVIAGAV